MRLDLQNSISGLLMFTRGYGKHPCERFSESNVAKGIYAGTVVLALILVGVLGVMSNYSNADIVHGNVMSLIQTTLI